MRWQRRSAMVGLVATLFGYGYFRQASYSPTTQTGRSCNLAGPVLAMQVVPGGGTLQVGGYGLQLRAEARAGEKIPWHDATTEATWSAIPAGLVAVDGGYLTPIKAGTARVRATIGSETTETSILVEAVKARTWDVAEDVEPVLTRLGCNAGGCHGRADGQNGLHLSLFGYDPLGDSEALTRRDAGRRLSAIDPAASLFLLKATGAIPHVGGPRLAVGSPEYRLLEAWIADGAPTTLGKTPGRLASVRVEPGTIRLDAPGAAQVRVVARYADGTERDVTRQSIYKSNDDSAATVDPNGRATLLRRAETDLIVRYGTEIVSARIGATINPDLAYDFAARPRRNVVDEELFKRLESLKIPPSPPATDAAFLRRISLDLTGQQPRPEQVRAFLADDDPEKRPKLVDRLLKERDFVRFWSIKLGDMLEVTSARPELAMTAGPYLSWISARLADGTPWDAIVRTLLTSIGDPTTREDAAANYALEGSDPKEQAEKTAQRFLGLRLRCAQCHNHPFDIWTQDDYFGLAAAFARVGRGGDAMMYRPKVTIVPDGAVTHLRTGKPAEARLLSREAIAVAPGDDPRKRLAAWITAPENPYFARAMANWCWAQLFGRGIADPPDDLSRANPPVHPELLDALAKSFVASKYDVRALLRTIATSEAYGLSASTVAGNERDDRFFSHQVPRALSAHQMADALAQVTDVPNVYRDQPVGKRAIEVADPASTSVILETFGRCGRLNGCGGVQTSPLSLRQSLLLIGGDVIESKVTHLNGYLANLLDLKPNAGEVVENLYIRALCRPPTVEEVAQWSSELEAAKSFREAAEDLFWSLLNSREFAFNH